MKPEARATGIGHREHVGSVYRRVEGALPFAGFRDTIEAVLRKAPAATGAPKSP